MDIRQLEYFRTVANSGSLTKAARLLLVSQPTITVALQKLENEVGVSLFDRSQKQFTLTTEGKLFLDRVISVLNRLEEAVGELNSYKTLQSGHVRIGILPLIGSFLFPKILANFKKYHPNVQFTIFEKYSKSINTALEKGELDIGIFNQPNVSNLLHNIHLVKQEILVCLLKSHPLAKQKNISLKQLRNEPMILFSETSSDRKVITQACLENGFAPNVILTTDQIESIKAFVSCGLGLSFMISSVPHKGTDLINIPLEEPLYLDFCVAWKKDSYLSVAAKTFVDFLTKNKIKA